MIKTIKADEKTHKRLTSYLFEMQVRNGNRRNVDEAINDLLDKAGE